MKKMIFAATAPLALLAMAGCQSPAEEAAENTADMVEDNADAVRDAADNTADAMEDKAGAVRAAGENKADAMEDRADKVRDAADK